MSNNITNTKKKLSIIFSIIVFVLIFILGIFYFSIKYINAYRFDMMEFQKELSIIETKYNTLEKLSSIKINLINPPIIKFEREDIKEFDKKDFWFKWALNILLFDKNNNILFTNIREDIEKEFILNILENSYFLNVQKYKSFMVKKISFEKDKNLIVFKKNIYSVDEYFEDIFWFTIIAMIFSFLVYFIWTKFVNKTFIPVEQNISDMKDFVHNAGHELKTPISVIDLNIQMMRDLKIYDDEMMLELKNEVIRLNSIIDSLVSLSDIDSLKDVQKNNLKEIISEINTYFSQKIKDKNIKINISIKENIFISANKDYFYMFLSNIIWNAIKYNNINWNIDILYNNNYLSIKDTWIWIDNKDINKIWDRFFKSDKSRNSEWFDIWLSLVKKIADIYKWKIDIKSEVDKWSEFIVHFSK